MNILISQKNIWPYSNLLLLINFWHNKFFNLYIKTMDILLLLDQQIEFVKHNKHSKDSLISTLTQSKKLIEELQKLSPELEATKLKSKVTQESFTKLQKENEESLIELSSLKKHKEDLGKLFEIMKKRAIGQ